MRNINKVIKIKSKILKGYKYGAVAAGILTYVLLSKQNSELKKTDVLKTSIGIRNAIKIEQSYQIETLLGKEIIADDLCTKALFSLIDNLTVDAKKTDFNDINYFSNLNFIVIKNIGYLTNEDIELLINSNIKTIKILIDTDNFKEEINHLNNLPIITNHKVVVSLSINEGLHQDLKDLYVYRKGLIANYNYTWLTESRMELLKIWDNELQKTIDSLDLSNDDDTEKIIKILYQTSKKICYDHLIANSTNKLAKYEKSTEYNLKTLNNILNKKGEVEGVCTSYAAYTSILASYVDIDLPIVGGNHEEEGHSWCTINIDDEKYIVDPTMIDNTLEKYVGSNIPYEDFKELIQSFLFFQDEKYVERDKEFFFSSLLTDYNTQLEKEITYINEKAKKYNIAKNSNIFVSDILILACLVVILYLIQNQLELGLNCTIEYAEENLLLDSKDDIKKLTRN